MDEYKVNPIHQKIDDAIWALYHTITDVANPEAAKTEAAKANPPASCTLPAKKPAKK